MLLGIWHCSLQVGRHDHGRLRTFRNLKGRGWTKSNLSVSERLDFAGFAHKLRKASPMFFSSSWISIGGGASTPSASFHTFWRLEYGIQFDQICTLRSKLSEEQDMGLPAHGTSNSQSLSCLSNDGSPPLLQAAGSWLAGYVPFPMPIAIAWDGLNMKWIPIEMNELPCGSCSSSLPCGSSCSSSSWCCTAWHVLYKSLRLDRLFLQTEHPKLTMVPRKFGGCIQTWIVQGCRCIKKSLFLNTSSQT